MKPCYIVTYSLTGPCIVNTTSVVKREEHQPHDRCLLHFKDGSTLLLDETSAQYDLRTASCTAEMPAGDLPVYG
jgi:hypothetical protein